MPFYEYECPKCGHHEEVLQSINDKPLTKCPNCGKSGFKKLVSAPVFRLKGSGWYETDFKSDKENKRNLAGGDKDEAPKKEDKSESKADAKAESKPEPKPEKSASAKPAPVKTAASSTKSKARSASKGRRGARR